MSTPESEQLVRLNLKVSLTAARSFLMECLVNLAERKHCIGFSKGLATDSANTFFGNPPPPEHSEYRVEANQIIFGSSVYDISEDGTKLTTIKGSTTAGTVLTLEK